MVITNRGCRRTEGANATKILFTSSKPEAMQSLERATPNRFEASSSQRTQEAKYREAAPGEREGRSQELRGS